MNVDIFYDVDAQEIVTKPADQRAKMLTKSSEYLGKMVDPDYPHLIYQGTCRINPPSSVAIDEDRYIFTTLGNTSYLLPDEWRKSTVLTLEMVTPGGHKAYCWGFDADYRKNHYPLMDYLRKQGFKVYAGYPKHCVYFEGTKHVHCMIAVEGIGEELDNFPTVEIDTLLGKMTLRGYDGKIASLEFSDVMINRIKSCGSLQFTNKEHIGWHIAAYVYRQKENGDRGREGTENMRSRLRGMCRLPVVDYLNDHPEFLEAAQRVRDAVTLWQLREDMLYQWSNAAMIQMEIEYRKRANL